MTKIAYVGVAAMLLASAPALALETAGEPAKAPETAATNEVTEPAAEMAAPNSDATEAAEATEAADTAAAAPADAIVCKRGKTVRNVNVVAPGSEGRVCEVHYAKPTEGVADRVLWYANSDKSFCDERANNLMSRLTSAGFSCVNPDGTPVSIETSAPATDSSPDSISAPETSPEATEIDHPDTLEEPADAPETPAEKPGGKDDQ